MKDEARLKAEILANQFTTRLREEAWIDEAEFGRLVDNLRLLAETWRKTERVDKNLAESLVTIPQSVAVTLDSARRNGWDSSFRARTSDILLELNSLVEACFSSD